MTGIDRFSWKIKKKIKKKFQILLTIKASAEAQGHNYVFLVFNETDCLCGKMPTFLYCRRLNDESSAVLSKNNVFKWSNGRCSRDQSFEVEP